jgi:glycosyltransferase involved in cell wall biosynthesis
MIGNFNTADTSVPPNTRIIGEIHDPKVLDEHYKKAHLLLLTSRREGWGLVVFEGMNLGVVPITTDVGELSQHISAVKQNGVLIENLQDTESLAKLFVEDIECFVHDRAKLQRFSKAAFNTVRQLAEDCDFEAAYRKALCV